MSFYGYRSTEMLREIAKWADGRATVYTPKLQTYSSPQRGPERLSWFAQ